MMNKKSKSKIIVISVLVAFVIFLILFLSINSNKPSDTFIRIIDRVYTTDDIQVYDSNEKDVTDEFREKYRNSYDKGDYNEIYKNIPEGYKFGSHKPGALE